MYCCLTSYWHGRYSSIPFNVQISALPLLDPLVPGRMESMPNRLAFVPQFGTSLSNNMVSPSCLVGVTVLAAVLHVEAYM